MATSTRIAGLAVLLAFLSNLAIVGFVYVRTHDRGEAALRARILEEATSLASVYQSAGRDALEMAVIETMRTGDPQLAIGLFDVSGKPIAGNLSGIEPGSLARRGYRTGLVGVRPLATPVEAGFVVSAFPDGWLVSGRTLGEVAGLRHTLERSLLLAVALSLLLGPIYGVVIARYVGARVDAIRHVVDAAGEGDLGRRVPARARGGDAFDLLAGRINHMLDRLGSLMGELRLLTDSLAHDLRSPVSRLRARIERAMTVADEAQREVLLAGVIVEADALMRILTTVIEIGKSEAGAGRDQFDWVDPAALAGELAEMYEPLVEEAGLRLEVRLAQPLRALWGHQQLLAQALSNLVDNAIRHAPGGGTVAIVADIAEGALRLGVADRGPGIGAADMAAARRRFGRLDAARTVSGAGLGLSLVEAVAHLHGGTLSLGDNAPGLVALIVLPLRSGGAPPPPLDSDGFAN